MTEADREQCRLIDAYIAWYNAERRVAEQRARAKVNQQAYRDRQKLAISGRWMVATKAAAAARRKSA